MKAYIIHYRLKTGKTGRERLTAANPFEATILFLSRNNLTFRDLAGVLSKTAK